MVQPLNKKYRRTTLITLSCVAFLLGLGLGRTAGVTMAHLWVGLIFCVVTLPRMRLPALVAVMLLGFSLGSFRGSTFDAQLTTYENLFGENITIVATASSDAVYSAGGQLEFDADTIEINFEDMKVTPPGTIKVQGYGAPSVARGDRVALAGKLFPTGGSRQARMSYAQISVVRENTGAIDNIRRRFVAGMFNAVPEPEASFGLGLLIGQRTTLPDSLEKQLSVAGLTHIIAVSGYNLTIIVRMVRRALGKRSKYQSTLIAFVLIGFFVLVTGFSASIVRAAVVSTLSLLAWYYGRNIKPLLLLAFAAAVTAAWNPVYIWSDIGWYLSFLAFFGVLIIAPLLKQRLYGDKEQKLLGQVVLESVCAQIMAAPLILYIFGEVSLIALVSNAIIVPLVPLAMLFSLFAGLAGMFIPVISGFIALPATILLTYMLDLVAVFARIPGALLETTITLNDTLYVYGVIVVFTVILRQVLKRKYVRITDRNIIE